MEYVKIPAITDACDAFGQKLPTNSVEDPFIFMILLHLHLHRIGQLGDPCKCRCKRRRKIMSRRRNALLDLGCKVLPVTTTK
jgi:hypothetical protein